MKENTISNEEGAYILGEPPILNAYRLQRSERRRKQYPNLCMSSGYVLVEHEDINTSEADANVPRIRAEAEKEDRNIGMRHV